MPFSASWLGISSDTSVIMIWTVHGHAHDQCFWNCERDLKEVAEEAATRQAAGRITPPREGARNEVRKTEGAGAIRGTGAPGENANP